MRMTSTKRPLRTASTYFVPQSNRCSPETRFNFCVSPMSRNSSKALSPYSPSMEFLSDYEHAPQPRQQEICQYLVGTALSSQADIIRQKAVEVLRTLEPLTQMPVRLEIARQIQERVARKRDRPHPCESRPCNRCVTVLEEDAASRFLSRISRQDEGRWVRMEGAHPPREAAFGLGGRRGTEALSRISFAGVCRLVGTCLHRRTGWLWNGSESSGFLQQYSCTVCAPFL